MNKKKPKNINTVNVILSILVAFAAWIFVVYNVSPTINKTYRDVPLEYKGEYELGQRGLGVLEADEESVNVTVTVDRRDLQEINESDIKAVVDVSSAVRGSNNLDISVETSSKLTVVKQSSENLNVEVTQSDNRDVEVEVGYDADSDSATEPVATEVGVNMVSVIGAKELVAKVDHVLIPLKESSLTESEESYTVNPVAVDENGILVKNIVVLPSEVSLTAYKANTKTVKLKITVSDDAKNDSKKYTVPETVTIKGRDSVLKDIEEIEAESVDISDVSSKRDIPIKLNLPDGVLLSIKSKNISVSVNFK